MEQVTQNELVGPRMRLIQSRRLVSPNKVNFNFEGQLVLPTQPLQPKRGIQKEKKKKTKLSRERVNSLPKTVKKVSNLSEILSYYINEGQEESSNRPNSLEQWQVKQLQKQVEGLSLGNFIIGLPNPDNPHKKLMQFLQYDHSTTDERYLIRPNEALNLYEELFMVDNETNINLSERQKTCFCLALYMMDIPRVSIQELEKSALNKEELAAVKNFNQLFEYYKKIENAKVEEYLVLRKVDRDVYEAEYLVPEGLNRSIALLARPGEPQKVQDQFTLIKRKVHDHLKRILERRIVEKPLHQNGSFFRLVLGSNKHPSCIFGYFSIVTQMVLEFIMTEKDQANKFRLLLKGGQLERKQKSSSQQFIWYDKGGPPRDVLTLFRNVLMYKLTRKANMFVRQFLSRDEHMIMLVVDSNDDNLEVYAQNNNVLMEVDMGSIDLFSFEPIDRYGRPLRLHSYVRDRNFYQKYQLGSNKSDKDQINRIKSVESDISNYFVKATKLNRDQLRVKIILDQEQLDNAYRWISQKLNIYYIEPQAVLTNEFNSDDVDESVWETYYVYVKLVLEYHRRIKASVEACKLEPHIQKEMVDNLGLMYRLAFSKAIEQSNQIYVRHNSDTFLKKAMVTLFGSTLKLSNLWDVLSYDEPTAYCQYVKKKRLEKIWRKYEINERRQRSKFVSSQRLYLTNRIIHSCVNVTQGIATNLIAQFFPLHDPYLLKGIKVQPYVHMLQDPKEVIRKNKEGEDTRISDILKMFESKKCESDFTRQSIQEKVRDMTTQLQFKITNFSKYTQLSIETIKNYSGQKIALFFYFIKFVTNRLKIMFVISFLMQIMLWVEYSDLLATGTTTLKQANNVLLLIFSLLNILWMGSLVEKWKKEENSFSEKFGLSDLTEEQEKSNLFKGKFMRSLEDDNMNYEFVPVWKKTLKLFYSSFISVVFAILLVVTVLLVFAFKGYLVETNVNQHAANAIPAILITLVIRLFSWIYKWLSKKLTDFENHKTLSQYEQSLIFKQYTVIFVSTFSSLFTYAFFSTSFGQVQFCTSRTTINTFIVDCSLQVSNQMFAITLVNLIFDIINALYPYLKFRYRQFVEQKRENTTKTVFSSNQFEAIDSFIEEQRRMESFMYSQEVDMTALSYVDFIVRLTVLALFGPSFPLSYCLLYVNGILALHTNKFQILMLSRRTLPIKTKSIGIWSNIIEVISFLGVIINLSYVIYTRQLVTTGQVKLFLSLSITLFLLKFYLSAFLNKPSLRMMVLEERNSRNIKKALLGVKRLYNTYVPADINTDISNVDYQEVNERRKLPELSKANVRTKETLHY